MGSLFECFLRAVTGAGPVVATAVATAVGTAVGTAVATAVGTAVGTAVATAAATAGPAQATAFIKQSESFPTGVLQLIGVRFVFQKRIRSGQQTCHLLTYTGYQIRYFGGHLLPYTGDQNWIV